MPSRERFVRRAPLPFFGGPGGVGISARKKPALFPSDSGAVGNVVSETASKAGAIADAIKLRSVTAPRVQVAVKASNAMTECMMQGIHGV